MEFTNTSVFFLVSAFVWLLWGRRKPAWDPMAPARLFGTIWLAAIGVTTLYWSELQMRWTVWSWTCVLGSMGAFLGGTWLSEQKERFAQTKIPVAVAGELDPKRYVRLTSILFTVCTLGYLVRVISIGVIPVLAESTEVARWMFYDIVGGSSLAKVEANLAFLATAVIIACSVFLFSVQGRSGREMRTARIRICLLVLGSFLLLLSTGFRGLLLTTLAVTTVLYHYLRRKLGAVPLLLMAAVVLAIGLGLVAFRHLTSAGYGIAITYSLAEMKIPPEWALLAEPYANIGLSMNNIVVVFERPPVWTLGALTLGPIWAALGIKWFFLRDVTLPFLPAYGFNTATYLYPLYQDFGVAGIWIGPFLFGLIAGRTYHRMLRTGKLVYAAAYGFIAMLIIFSILDNLFVLISFWLNFLAVYSVIRLSQPGPSAVPPKLSLVNSGRIGKATA